MKRGRFAPSPTGPLHFGSLLAALASFCDARSAGGEWLLRIEDVDLPRARADAADNIQRTLQRYGFGWDGPVLKQSDRTRQYAAALQALDADGRIYACGCSRRDLAHCPVGATGERVYPGTCSAGLLPGRSARARRVRVGSVDVDFRDRVQGGYRQDLAAEAGDFVLRRADGIDAYHLAVVVDDAAQAITDVVRGADLLPSTPRQILLQRYLGYPTPEYLHIPVALDVHGQKLSKQSGAPALPDRPLPMLAKAWSFLRQPAADHTFATTAEFWNFAVRAWDPARIPAVAALRAE